MNTQGRQSFDDQTADGIRQKRSIGFYEGLAMLSGTAANESRCLAISPLRDRGAAVSGLAGAEQGALASGLAAVVHPFVA